MTRSGLSQAITALTSDGLVMSQALRSSAQTSNDGGQAARQTSRPIWPLAPKTRSFTTLGGGSGLEFAAVRQELVEILDGAGKAVFERGGGAPSEERLRLGDVGAALRGIIDRQRPADDRGARAGHLEDHLGELGDR